jgi:predicted aldo/keto reductase-like oxidoreductase
MVLKINDRRKSMKRRDFVSLMGGAAVIPVERLLADFRPADDIARRVAGLPRRVFGRTKREISIVGFPGLCLSRINQEESNAAVKRAFQRGVNYFDVAPAYGQDGECEIKLGPALQQLNRGDIFLACKTKARDKESSRLELERSLSRLKTDHFDLYQMHHLVTQEEVKHAFGPGGAIETFKAARDEGKIKWMGFSAHSTRAAIEALKAFPFDTVMFPISFADFYIRDFGRQVIDLAGEKGAAVIAIKTLSMGAWPKGAQRTRDWWYRTAETQEEVNLALRFSLSLKGVAAGIPPSWVDLLDKIITAGGAYKPATTADLDGLKILAKSCEALFTAEGLKGDGASLDHRGPYPDHPYGYGTEA